MNQLITLGTAELCIVSVKETKLMAKKIFIISAIVFAIILAVILGVYFFFPNEKEKSAPTQPDPSQEVPTPPADNAKIKQLLEGKIVGATMKSTGTGIVYYLDNNFVEIELDGQSRNNVGAYPFPDVLDIVWSSDKRKAAIKTSTGFYYYNFDANSVFKLKEGVDVVGWVAKGDRIVYKYYDKATTERSLSVADPDGSNWKELKKTELRKVDFQNNPATNEIGYYASPDSFTLGELWGISSDGAGERKIFEGRFGADFLWSPDGKKILASFVTEKGGRAMEIGVANQNGGEYKTLGFPTSVKKCAWSHDNVHLYCAMLGAVVKEGDVLPNDWQSGKLTLADTFWKINTQNGKKDRIIELTDLNESFDAVNLMLDADEKQLFFVDKKNGGLYRISL